MPSKKKYNARFPPARIKKIMQTDEEVGKVAAPVPVIISRVLELFVKNLLNEANKLAISNQARTLQSAHLSQAISADRRLHFLQETVRQQCKGGTPAEGDPDVTCHAAGAAADTGTSMEEQPNCTAGDALDGSSSTSSTTANIAAAGTAAFITTPTSSTPDTTSTSNTTSSTSSSVALPATSAAPQQRASPLRSVPVSEAVAGTLRSSGPASASGSESAHVTVLPARGRGRPRGRPPKRPMPDLTPLSSAIRPASAFPPKRGRGRPRKQPPTPQFMDDHVQQAQQQQPPEQHLPTQAQLQGGMEGMKGLQEQLLLLQQQGAVGNCDAAALQQLQQLRLQQQQLYQGQFSVPSGLFISAPSVVDAPAEAGVDSSVLMRSRSVPGITWNAGHPPGAAAADLFSPQPVPNTNAILISSPVTSSVPTASPSAGRASVVSLSSANGSMSGSSGVASGSIGSSSSLMLGGVGGSGIAAAVPNPFFSGIKIEIPFLPTSSNHVQQASSLPIDDAPTSSDASTSATGVTEDKAELADNTNGQSSSRITVSFGSASSEPVQEQEQQSPAPSSSSSSRKKSGGRKEVENNSLCEPNHSSSKSEMLTAGGGGSTSNNKGTNNSSSSNSISGNSNSSENNLLAGGVSFTIGGGGGGVAAAKVVAPASADSNSDEDYDA